MKNQIKSATRWLVLMLCAAFLLSFTAVLSGCGGTEKTVTDMQMMMPPEKTEYVEGETFDPAGMMITAVYSDGTRENITDYTIDKTGPLSLEDTEVKITYGEYTFTQPITVITAGEKVVLQLANGVDRCDLYADGTLALTGNLEGLASKDEAHWTWDGETLEIWITVYHNFVEKDDFQTKMDLQYDSQNNLSFRYALRGMFDINYFVSYADWSQVLTPDARYPIELG